VTDGVKSLFVVRKTLAPQKTIPPIEIMVYLLICELIVVQWTFFTESEISTKISTVVVTLKLLH
jgi:hypothetical protein